MKKTIVKNWIKALVFGGAVFMLPSCSDKSSTPEGKGEAEFLISDSPTDDPSVKSVFVTITDLKVDGNSVTGFTKQTIDLKAYQAGDTKVLFDGQLDAKTYNNLTLVLDADNDATSSGPGAYVQTTDNVKHKLGSGMINITAAKSMGVASNAKTTFVIDFDVRKSIKAVSDQSVQFNFVSQDNLQAAVRVVAQAKASTITGSYSEQVASNADMIVVYAYKTGTYDATTETTAQGDDAIMFKNAVSSSVVSAQSVSGKGFTLPFMETGDYELHFAAYKKDSASNKFVFQNMLNSTNTVGGNAATVVTVLGSGASISVTTVVTGAI